MVAIQDEISNLLKGILQDSFQTETLMTLLVALVALLAVIAIVLIYIAAKVKKIAEKPGETLVHPQAVPVAEYTAPIAQTGVNKSELVAVMAAAIAEASGTDASHLRIHSIRKI